MFQKAMPVSNLTPKKKVMFAFAFKKIWQIAKGNPFDKLWFEKVNGDPKG